jgi:hypothetical protein
MHQPPKAFSCGGCTMTPKAFLMGLVLASAIGSASAAEPVAGYKLNPELTEKSPDGAIIIEQYMKTTDDDAMWQFWIRREGRGTLLNAQPAGYPAGFRFTSGLRWLVRTQKTGAGYSTLYLYKSGAKGFVPATRQPIGDLAWDYLRKRPECLRLRQNIFRFICGLHTLDRDDHVFFIGRILAQRHQRLIFG